MFLSELVSHKLEFWVATASLILAPAEGLGAVCWSVSWSFNQSSMLITTFSGIRFERGVNICSVYEDLDLEDMDLGFQMTIFLYFEVVNLVKI